MSTFNILESLVCHIRDLAIDNIKAYDLKKIKENLNDLKQSYLFDKLANDIYYKRELRLDDAIKKGFDIDCKDSCPGALLNYIIAYGAQLSYIQLAVKHGADVTLLNKYSRKYLKYYCNKNQDVIDILWKAGLNI